MRSNLPSARFTLALAAMMVASCTTLPKVDELVCVRDPDRPDRIVCTTRTVHPVPVGM